MTGREAIVRLLAVCYATWISLIIATALPVLASCTREACRILVVGDVGIGDDAFEAGFLAVQQAMVKDAPDLVLYMGDYIYTKHTCEWQTPAGGVPPYLAAVRNKLVAPFLGQVVFARGDNDAAEGDSDWAKAGRRCWKTIAEMGIPLTKPPGAGAWEGVVEDLPGVLIAVLDADALAYDKLSAPDYWLREPVMQAKNAGKWVLVVVHEPVITTAWFSKPCCATLKPFHDMGVDVVFSGHQHSFERTYQLEVPTPPDRVHPVRARERALHQAGVYRAGEGVVYVVTGGGGAWLRPFADQQSPPPAGFVAPDYIKRAVARRANMNHYVRVDMETDRVGVTTVRVCADGEARWKADDATVWPGGPSMLECHGKSLGTSVFDHFELRKYPQGAPQESTEVIGIQVRDMLAELSGKVFFGGFGSEGEHGVEVVHLPMQVTQLDGANFTAAIEKLTGAQVKLQDADSGLKALLAINDRGEASAAAEQIVQIMKTHLSDLTAFVVAENAAGKAELRGKLPVYLLGRAPDGSLVGLKSYVVWT